jgi:hypothetical protein
MTLRDLGQDRDRLATIAVEFWTRLKSSAPVEQANALTAESDAIVEYWESANKAEELLLPMLDSSSVEVQYAAAASLARYRPSDLAWRTLAALSAGNHGLVSSSAELLLMNRPR